MISSKAKLTFCIIAVLVSSIQRTESTLQTVNEWLDFIVPQMELCNSTPAKEGVALPFFGLLSLSVSARIISRLKFQSIGYNVINETVNYSSVATDEGLLDISYTGVENDDSFACPNFNQNWTVPLTARMSSQFFIPRWASNGFVQLFRFGVDRDLSAVFFAEEVGDFFIVTLSPIATQVKFNSLISDNFFTPNNVFGTANWDPTKIATCIRYPKAMEVLTRSYSPNTKNVFPSNFSGTTEAYYYDNDFVDATYDKSNFGLEVAFAADDTKVEANDEYYLSWKFQRYEDCFRLQSPEYCPDGRISVEAPPDVTVSCPPPDQSTNGNKLRVDGCGYVYIFDKFLNPLYEFAKVNLSTSG